MDQLSSLRREMARLRAAEKKGPASAGPHIWAIGGGKGGTGKSLIAAATALLLARSGKRVLITDFDSTGTGCRIFFDVDPGSPRQEWFLNRRAFDQYLVSVDDRLDIWTGTDADFCYEQNPGLFVRKLIEDAADRYQIVLLDLPSGMSGLHRAVTERCHEMTVVCGVDYTSVASAYAFVKIVQSINPELHLSAVINRTASIAEGLEAFGRLHKMVQHFLSVDISLHATVREHRAVLSWSHQMRPISTWPLQNALFTELLPITNNPGRKSRSKLMVLAS